MKQINSLYIHFPFCRHLCNYCDFYKKIPESIEEYSAFEKSLVDMWERHDSLLDQFDYKMDSIETLYIGGGTPSLWGSRGADFLEKLFHKKEVSLLKNDNQGEFTLEVNPGSWKEEDILSWRNFGINRFSLGIQALNSDYLKLLDRVHDIDDVHDILNFFNSEKLNFSVDFMLGLPCHDKLRPRDIEDELDQIFKYDPSHVSLYILTTKKTYVHKDLLPDEEEVASEYERVVNYFAKKNWHHYEVSNFSKPGFESRHNLSYWRSRSVGAIGASAVGYLAEDGYRYKWKSKTIDFESETLTKEQVEIERLYMGLRITDGIDLDDRLPSGFNNLVDKWCSEGFATLNGEKVILTSRGFLLIDMLMDQIFTL